MKKYKITVDGILYEVEVEEVASAQMPLSSAPVTHTAPAVHAYETAPMTHTTPAAHEPAQFMHTPVSTTPAAHESAQFMHDSALSTHAAASAGAVTHEPVPAPATSNVQTPLSSPTSDSSITIKAPMPGKVLSVEVTAGQQVAAGDVILVLEAMKMENEILAPAAGRVLTVSAAKDAQVNTGDVLAVLG